MSLELLQMFHSILKLVIIISVVVGILVILVGESMPEGPVSDN